MFDIKELGVSVFNKERILLMNRHVERIPPVDDPNGHALLFNLPLYNRKDPDGEPVGYLTSYAMGQTTISLKQISSLFRWTTM